MESEDSAEDVKNWLVEQDLLEQEDEITDAFVELLIDIVRDKHKSGLLTDKFGEEIPVLIHELEYYDKIV